jgi:AraC-like DNA-binding protein
MSTHAASSAHFSTLGRPRRVTDAQITEILAWHVTHVTLKAKAAQLGLSPSVLRFVIRTAGKAYKQPSPEQRADNLVADRLRRARQYRANGL